MLGFGGLVLLQTAIGLARSRQWALLPLALGLTALAGFLINPLADATTSHQLRGMLSSHEVLTSLAISQMILAASALVIGLRLSASRRAGRWSLWLGSIHSLPAPALIVARLFWEHAWLAHFVGARPELVGRNVGLGMALLLAICAFAVMAVAARKLALVHYNNDPQQVGVAVSDDGVEFTRLFDEPFLPNGPPRSWNSSESGHPFLFRDDDGQDYLFYQGNNDGGRPWYLSVEPIDWEDGLPVLAPEKLPPR